MRWHRELPPEIPVGTTRRIKKFLLWPVFTEEGTHIWLEDAVIIQKYNKIYGWEDDEIVLSADPKDYLRRRLFPWQKQKKL